MEEDIKIIKASKIMSDDIPHSEHSKRLRKALENLIKGYRELEIENQSYRDYLGEPPCYDNAKYIPKSRIQAKIEEFETQINNYEMIARYSKDIMQVRMMGEALGILRGFRDLLQELMEDKWNES